METLTEAVEVLARGLEGSPMSEPGGDRAREAARRTHELLLLVKAAGPGGGGDGGGHGVLPEGGEG